VLGELFVGVFLLLGRGWVFCQSSKEGACACGEGDETLATKCFFLACLWIDVANESPLVGRSVGRSVSTTITTTYYLLLLRGAMGGL
jgi:hypothetical protein